MRNVRARGVLGAGAIGSDAEQAYAAGMNESIGEAVQEGKPPRVGIPSGGKNRRAPFEAIRDISGEVASVADFEILTSHGADASSGSCVDRCTPAFSLRSPQTAD